METKPEPMRARLLAQFEPDQDKFVTYRKEVEAMLEKNEQTLRRQKWYAQASWIFVVVLGTGFLLLGGLRGDVSPGAWLGLFACFLLIGSAVELVKYFINRSRLELLKEMKGIELQLLEIKQHLQNE